MLEHQILARVPDRESSTRMLRSAGGMKASVIEAVDAAEYVIAAVYVVPTAGRALRGAGGALTNSVAMDDATGSLLTRFWIALPAGRWCWHGQSVFGAGFPAIETMCARFECHGC